MEKGRVLISRLRFDVLQHCSQRKGQHWAASEGMLASMRYFPPPRRSTGEGLWFAQLPFVSGFLWSRVVSGAFLLLFLL